MGGAAGVKPRAGTLGGASLAPPINLNAIGRIVGNQSVAMNPRGGTLGDPIGGIDIPEADLRDPFGGQRGEIGGNLPDPRDMNWLSSLFNPPAGTPGASQGPTIDPTTFDAQGYPYAIPVQPFGIDMSNPSDPVGLMHAGQHINPNT